MAAKNRGEQEPGTQEDCVRNQLEGGVTWESFEDEGDQGLISRLEESQSQAAAEMQESMGEDDCVRNQVEDDPI